MKKLIAVIALVFSVSFVFAQTDTTRIKFDYYPTANVYYNTKAKTYWYFDAPKQKWESVSKLPTNISVSGNDTKKALYSDDPNIWKNNYNHQKMFGKKN